MPYIQLFIKGQHPAWHKQISPSPDLREVDAGKELQELREQFPLQQSGGIFYRMNHDSVLFEQPVQAMNGSISNWYHVIHNVCLTLPHLALPTVLKFRSTRIISLRKQWH